MILYCQFGPIVMILNSFLHCDHYLSTGVVTRGQARSNHVSANNLVRNQYRYSKVVLLCFPKAAKSNDMQHEAVKSSRDPHVTSGHLE